MKRKITVVGSINVDMVTTTARIPSQGETILGDSFQTVPGGKGANQAVAAARLGAEVTMLGKVGADMIGKEMIANLEKNNIFTANVEPVTDVPTGVATILLTEGDNRIIVTPGANSRVTPDYIRSKETVIKESDAILVQLEIPLEAVIVTLELAEKHAVPVIINPAPAQELPQSAWDKATWITPNEQEKKQLFSKKERNEQLITTLGHKGASFQKDGKEYIVPGYVMDAIDTTGAGDTFNGALTTAIAEEKTITEAVQFANAAAALSVTKFGAQGGMPTKQEVEALLKGEKQRAEKRNT
ncbi:ribokinase [Salipaludibacillus keqinensis]|uniref:Ribokinase n=1 Tax=Salipaludibacillus keqinensis TaxID=2045207 RepID=A0A323TGC3_9BACI|nr:ribokinase [Salipaludibacillus keqinensis]PYZ92607.1 ribokinase [Salipaludibacillus keqinensis]